MFAASYEKNIQAVMALLSEFGLSNCLLTAIIGVCLLIVLFGQIDLVFKYRPWWGKK